MVVVVATVDVVVDDNDVVGATVVDDGCEVLVDEVVLDSAVSPGLQATTTTAITARSFLIALQVRPGDELAETPPRDRNQPGEQMEG